MKHGGLRLDVHLGAGVVGDCAMEGALPNLEVTVLHVLIAFKRGRLRRSRAGALCVCRCERELDVEVSLAARLGQGRGFPLGPGSDPPVPRACITPALVCRSFTVTLYSKGGVVRVRQASAAAEATSIAVVSVV